MDRLHPSAVDARQRQCALVPDVRALVSPRSCWLVTPGRRVLREPLCASQSDQARLEGCPRCVHYLIDAVRRSEGLWGRFGCLLVLPAGPL